MEEKKEFEWTTKSTKIKQEGKNQLIEKLKQIQKLGRIGADSRLIALTAFTQTTEKRDKK